MANIAHTTSLDQRRVTKGLARCFSVIAPERYELQALLFEHAAQWLLEFEREIIFRPDRH